MLDLIRGRDVNAALATLRFARKSVAQDIEKVLRSAIANAQQKDGFGGDVERLFVDACYANQGPSQKRIRPAPMGRAFRVVKRTAHLTVRGDGAADQGARRGGRDRRRDAGRRRHRGAEAGPGREAQDEVGGARKKTAAKKTAARRKSRARGSRADELRLKTSD